MCIKIRICTSLGNMFAVSHLNNFPMCLGLKLMKVFIDNEYSDQGRIMDYCSLKMMYREKIR